jgi:hypothetical protein
MEWLSTFIFQTVEFLDKLTDNIGKHMWKFLFICFVIFLAMLLWPKPPTPMEQRGIVEKGAVQEKTFSDRLKEWMIENTPKQ